MKHVSFCFGRRLALGLALGPLFALGSCAVITQTSVIKGFFDIVTPILVDNARAAFGLTPLAAGTASTRLPNAVPRPAP